MVVPFITKIGHTHDFSSMISLSKVSAIFNFEITWASNPISLANWLIWLSPIRTFNAHCEESAFQNQKYQTWQIFSSQPWVAKFSGKTHRTREETAEQTALPGHLLSYRVRRALTSNTSFHSHDTRTKNNLHLPRIRTNCDKQWFADHTPRIHWIDHWYKNSTSLAICKSYF